MDHRGPTSEEPSRSCSKSKESERSGTPLPAMAALSASGKVPAYSGTLR